MKIHCAHNALANPATLKPNPTDPNQSRAHQIQLLASIIQDQGWRGPITVSKRSGLIVPSSPPIWRKPVAPPDYAFDGQTRKGRKMGKSKAEFFRAEQAALEPFQPGLCDDLVDG